MKKTSLCHSAVPTFLIFLATLAALPAPRSAQGQTRDLVGGNLIQFNDNGAWCWYQDERAVIDRTGGTLIVAHDCSASGLGGSPRNGEIDAVIFSLTNGTSQRFVIMSSGGNGLGCDDHDTPGLLVMTNGQYLAAWSGHNDNAYTYWRVYDPNTGTWGSQSNFNWLTQTPGGIDFSNSYNNLHFLPAEGRIYDFTRGNGHGGQNIMTSTNLGKTFNYGGLMCSNLPPVTYVNGYFRYADDSVTNANGATRVDFICTEYHPRNYDTSIYHGYVSNGMTFRSDGTVNDTNIFDKIPTFPQSYTLVFSNGTVLPPGQTNYRCWNDDVQKYPDGTVECIITARINNDYAGGNDSITNCNHSFIFCRYDGTKWTSTYLCQAGYKMYSSEMDYVGLGCLNPNDPNTIYISTQWDPRTDVSNSVAHEIWKGVTTNHGASFTWTPITQNSVRDNFRPLVPAWDASDTALLWFRGTYSTAQIYDEAPVGLIEHRAEVVGPIHYVDATAGAGGNTTLTNGQTLTLSGSANQWHLQSGVGNGGTVLSSADSANENATNIMTQVTAPGSGTYDVWVNFWGTSLTSTSLTNTVYDSRNGDWRISAGLAADGMQTYRSEKCAQVQPLTQDSNLVLTNMIAGSNTNYLYQAYVGRVVLSNNLTIKVFVDDNAIRTGGNGTTLLGNTNRTWYDGISYAKVEPFQIQKVFPSGPSAMTLVWNSPPPEMSLTTPTYTVQKTASLIPPVTWTTVATGIPATSKAYATTNVDNSAGGNTAFYRVTWP